MLPVSISGQPEPEQSSTDQPPQGLPLKASVKRRLEREGRWYGIAEQDRDRLMREARARGMTKAAAQDWAYAEVDRLYPPLPETEAPAEEAEGDVALPADGPSGETEIAAASPTRPREESGVSGLSDLPASWPPLPPNASLAAEIQWVQSSRLDVVEELPGGAIRVHLERADRPAPSKAAIGWLETSIRAYSKYCDIAAKATAQAEDEREHVRREKLAIEEVRGLLSEMMDGQGK